MLGEEARHTTYGLEMSNFFPSSPPPIFYVYIHLEVSSTALSLEKRLFRRIVLGLECVIKSAPYLGQRISLNRSIVLMFDVNSNACSLAKSKGDRLPVVSL